MLESSVQPHSFSPDQSTVGQPAPSIDLSPYKKDLYSGSGVATFDLGPKKSLLKVPFERNSDFYSEEEVAARLRTPAGYADGNPGNTYRIPPIETRPRSPVSHIESSNWSLFAEGPTEKMYKGPIYLQGNEGTCHAWALIHAMHVVGLKPDVTLATKLLNGALPSDTNTEGGLGHFVAAELIDDSPHFTYEFAHELDDQLLSPGTFGAFLKKVIDEEGAVIACVKRPGPGKEHAICLSGYTLDSNNYMDVQFIDSNDGERIMPIEDFTAWAKKSGLNFRSIQFTVIRNKSNEQNLTHHCKPRSYSGLGNLIIQRPEI